MVRFNPFPKGPKNSVGRGEPAPTPPHPIRKILPSLKGMKTKLIFLSIASALLLAVGSAQAGVFTDDEIATSASPSEIDEQPRPTKQVAPNLPKEANGVAGYVRVAFLIDESGNVIAPRIEKSSDAVFEAAALDAIKGWKFKAAKKDGKSVTTRVVLPFRFKG